MQKMNIPAVAGVKRVVIIGGGFGGLELAKRLDRKLYQVVLIDKNNFHQFQPLFYQVAMGGLEPSSICYPLRDNFKKAKNFYFKMCRAERVEPRGRILETSIGAIEYDYLVVATGCSTNYFGNEALRETTFGLKSISESILIRNRILISLEKAGNTTNPEELTRILNFTIVGGGATGVELAGALADMRRSILPVDFPDVDFSKMEIHLINGTPRLLGGMSERSSKVALETLERRGVLVHNNVMVTDYTQPIITMSNGTQLSSDNVLWVGGVKANNIPGLDESAYQYGRLAVDGYCAVSGYDNIFAIGDTSLQQSEAKPKGHPQVAQVALQMANRLASNLNRKAKGKSTQQFKYDDKGSLATIGRNVAVADIGKLHFGGFFAWAIWLFVHVKSMIGLRNKLMVLIDWTWSYFNYRLSLLLLIRPESNKIYEEKE